MIEFALEFIKLEIDEIGIMDFNLLTLLHQNQDRGGKKWE